MSEYKISSLIENLRKGKYEEFVEIQKIDTIIYLNFYLHLEIVYRNDLNLKGDFIIIKNSKDTDTEGIIVNLNFYADMEISEFFVGVMNELYLPFLTENIRI